MGNKKDFLGPEPCFGYHADLHLWQDDCEAGKRANADELEKSLRELNADWVQVDTKGHPGYASWFSRIPTASVAPHLATDTVAAWREATNRLGLALIAHYSGFIDLAAGIGHPEWLAEPAPGFIRQTPPVWNEAWMCPRSGYFDQLMIPQLIELATVYQLDGAWIDGDVWGFRGCWCPRCREEFTRRTGIVDIPANATEDNWAAWWEFMKTSYRECVAHYLAEVRKGAPNFKICINWLNTARYPMPDAEWGDWLSGDLSPFGTLDDARFQVRWLSNRQQPWDLMSWSHLGWPDFQLKSLDMLCQEAAGVIAAGGRYICFEYSGGIRTSQQTRWRVRRLRQVGEFVRVRAPYCCGAKAMGEVAVLHASNQPYGFGSEVLTSAAWWTGSVLLENHYGVDIVDEWALLARLQEFSVVVIPEIGKLSVKLVSALTEYVEDGGRLLVAGVESMVNWGKDYFGIADWQIETQSPLQGKNWSFLGVKDSTPLYFLSDGRDGVFPLSSRQWGLGTAAADACGAETIYTSFEAEESATEWQAFFMKRHGRGWAAGIPAEIFSDYPRHFCMPELRAWVGRAMKRLLPERRIEVEAPTVIDVLFRQRQALWYVHLLNRSTGVATQPERKVIDEIPSVGPVTLRLRLSAPPIGIRLLPENTSLACEWQPGEGESDGIAVVVVPAVWIHETVEIQIEPKNA